MSTVRALIVDDEEPGRVNLALALADHPGWEVAASCASAAAARKVLEEGAIDVVFLDIQMPGESGMELAAQLKAQAAGPLVIFVTAHHSFALDAFAVQALDYLMKPIGDARLAQAVARAEAMLALRRHQAPPAYWQQLSVRSVGRIERVLLDDVRWIEACGNYVQLHLAGRSILHRVPVGRLMQHLDPARFVRVHRGAIVRIDRAEGLDIVGDGVYRLRLRGGGEVPVSERYVGALRACMQAD